MTRFLMFAGLVMALYACGGSGLKTLTQMKVYIPKFDTLDKNKVALVFGKILATAKVSTAPFPSPQVDVAGIAIPFTAPLPNEFNIERVAIIGLDPGHLGDAQQGRVALRVDDAQIDRAYNSNSPDNVNYFQEIPSVREKITVFAICHELGHQILNLSGHTSDGSLMDAALNPFLPTMRMGRSPNFNPDHQKIIKEYFGYEP